MLKKRLVRNLHLILGLLSGIVIFVVSLTGALYTFKSEIEGLYEGFHEVEATQDAELLPPSALFAVGEKTFPDKHIHGIKYGAGNESAEIIFYQPKPLFYAGLFVNPYTGKVLHTKHYLKSFFGLMLYGHISLWLPRSIGTPIVASAALVFLVLIISGMVLWWPGKRNKGKASSGSLNKQMHRVLGFYASWIAVIFVLTGLVWGFKWFGKAVYKATGGQQELSWSMPQSDTTQQATLGGQDPVDAVWHLVREAYPEAQNIEMHTLEDKQASILVELNPEPDTYWKTDYLFYDQYTLKLVQPKHVFRTFKEAGFPERLRRLNYDIHTGSIGGFAGKLLAFIASLFCASLPLTGFIMWAQRRRQRKKLMQM